MLVPQSGVVSKFCHNRNVWIATLRRPLECKSASLSDPSIPIYISGEGDAISGSAELDDDGAIEIEISFRNGDDAILKARHA